jgi:hypothetical protein
MPVVQGGGDRHPQHAAGRADQGRTQQGHLLTHIRLPSRGIRNFSINFKFLVNSSCRACFYFLGGNYIKVILICLYVLYMNVKKIISSQNKNEHDHQAMSSLHFSLSSFI